MLGSLLSFVLYWFLTFFYYPSTIDEARLAMYFATPLIDDATKRYVNAATERKLRVYDEKSGCNRLASPVELNPPVSLTSQKPFRKHCGS